MGEEPRYGEDEAEATVGNERFAGNKTVGGFLLKQTDVAAAKVIGRCGRGFSRAPWVECGAQVCPRRQWGQAACRH